MDNLRGTKTHLRHHLHNRYGKLFGDKILSILDLPTIFNFKAYCDKLNEVIMQPREKVIEIVFQLLDVNGDGVICLSDIFAFIKMISDVDYFWKADILQINSVSSSITLTQEMQQRVRKREKKLEKQRNEDKMVAEEQSKMAITFQKSERTIGKAIFLSVDPTEAYSSKANRNKTAIGKSRNPLSNLTSLVQSAKSLERDGGGGGVRQFETLQPIKP